MKSYLLEKMWAKQGEEVIVCDVVVTLDKACELLNVSHRTFYRHLEKGESKGIKISEYRQPELRVIKLYK